ncbi:hypothetical protein MBRA1_002554 [Malassezia brasiliensis]|uniref:Nitronate monooxygenase domain-containing protein n=1 Tax=Malassezia brasiliensis TaxID=1821822 RepID=A0AAF0DUF9_9BASI|nr:hypothetical protein MBRA1_002554 [Malassezia brasiliensis]
MPIKTYLTETLGLRVPVVMGGMQWPTPEELKHAIEQARSLIDPEIAKERSKYGAFGVNITLLPAVVPPDYEGYARAALEAGVRIFETAGNNPGPVIKILKDAGAFVIHKWECAGHPGEDDIGGLVLLALAADQVKAPFIASGGVANGRGLAATLALGAVGANMGTRFMATKESEIDDKIKQVIVQSGERDTAHILRSLRNTTRVFKNKITKEVLELEARHAEFKEIQPLVSGQRGRTVYTKGDPNAGVWTAGQTLGLIHDIPTCKELVARIEREAEERIRSTYAYVNGPSARL